MTDTERPFGRGADIKIHDRLSVQIDADIVCAQPTADRLRRHLSVGPSCMVIHRYEARTPGHEVRAWTAIAGSDGVDALLEAQSAIVSAVAGLSASSMRRVA